MTSHSDPCVPVTSQHDELKPPCLPFRFYPYCLARATVTRWCTFHTSLSDTVIIDHHANNFTSCRGHWCCVVSLFIWFPLSFSHVIYFSKQWCFLCLCRYCRRGCILHPALRHRPLPGSRGFFRPGCHHLWPKGWYPAVEVGVRSSAIPRCHVHVLGVESPQ